MTIDLFIPCNIDQFHPDTAVNTVKVLEKAKALGDKFISELENDRPVVIPSAACVAFIKKRYPELFFNTSNHLNVKRLVKNVYELTDFLVNVLQFDDFGAEFPHKVTFHDSCSAIRELGIGIEARQLLSKVKGLELVEMKQTDMCCGGELTLAMNHEEVAVGMASHKVRNALNTGAEYIVSTDVSCLMHQHSYIDANGLPIHVIHIADILAEGC